MISQGGNLQNKLQALLGLIKIHLSHMAGVP